MDIIETIKEQIQGNRILLYMKGSPNSATVRLFGAHGAGADGLR